MGERGIERGIVCVTHRPRTFNRGTKNLKVDLYYSEDGRIWPTYSKSNVDCYDSEQLDRAIVHIHIEISAKRDNSWIYIKTKRLSQCIAGIIHNDLKAYPNGNRLLQIWNRVLFNEIVCVEGVSC